MQLAWLQPLPVKLILTAVAGIVGALLLWRTKIPGKLLLGSLIGTTLFSVLTGAAYVPSRMKIVSQTVAGAFVGMKISKRELRELKSILLPTLVFFVLLSGTAFLFGYLIYWLTPLDLLTSLLAATPAGVLDISLISLEMGADAAKVVTLQVLRVLIGVGVFPSIVRAILKKRGGIREPDASMMAPKQIKDKRTYWMLILRTAGVAAAAGITGYLVGIPAGTITLAMLGVGAYNILTESAILPIWMRTLAQILSGMLIGVTVGMDDVLGLTTLWGAALLIIAECVLINFGIGLLIGRIFKVDLGTMLFASNPSGLTDMALIAHEIGADSPKVTVVQLVRYAGVLMLFPTIIGLVTG